MPETKKVKELMVPVSVYLKAYDTDSLKDCIQALKRRLAEGKEYRSILIFSSTKKINNEEELVGILTIRDILNAIKKKTMSYDVDELYTMSWALFFRSEPLRKVAANKAGEAIRPLVNAYLQSDEDVTRAVRLMMTKNVNILPVFENNKLVGIIRALDILDYIGEML